MICVWCGAEFDNSIPPPSDWCGWCNPWSTEIERPNLPVSEHYAQIAKRLKEIQTKNLLDALSVIEASIGSGVILQGDKPNRSPVNNGQSDITIYDQYGGVIGVILANGGVCEWDEGSGRYKVVTED